MVKWSEIPARERREMKKELAAKMRKEPTPGEAKLLRIAQGCAPDGRWKPQRLVLGYIGDVVSDDLRIVLEADGGHHASGAQAKHDEKRDKVMRGRGWWTMRFTNDEILEKSDLVADAIRSARLASIEALRSEKMRKKSKRIAAMRAALEAVVKRGCPECASIAADALRECGY